MPDYPMPDYPTSICSALACLLLAVIALPGQAQWSTTPTTRGVIETGQIQSPGGHSRAEFITWDCADSQCQDRSFYADMNTFVPRSLVPMHAWYIRAFPGGFNDAFPLPQSAVLFGDTATAHWAGGGVDGVLSATLTLRVEDPNGVPDEGQARLVQHMTISNSGTSDQVINLFAYADIEANGDSNNDTAENGSSADEILIVINDDVGSIPVSEIQVRAPGADRLQVAPYDAFAGLPETVLLGSSADLDNSGLPFGPGDITLAVQWSDTVIPAGGAVTFRLIIAENSAPTDEYDGIAIEVFPNALDLGTVAIGETTGDLVTVTNTGAVELEVQAWSGPDAPFSVTGGNCPAPPFDLQPQAGCTVEVSFQPSQFGTFESTFSVLSDADTAVVTLVGRALVPGPGIALEPDYVELLGVQVGDSATGEVILRNTGTATLNVQTLTQPSPPFSVSGLGTCPTAPFSLPSGAACSLAVQFTPSETGGFSDALDFTSNAGPARLPLYGESWVPGPSIHAYPGWLDFGLVELGMDATATLTVESTGTQALTIHALDGPSAPFGLHGGTCDSPPFSLEPGLFCTLNYRFAPEADGVAASSIIIRSDALTGDIEIPLSGESPPEPQPVLVLDSVDVDFGALEPGSGVSRRVTLSNGGNLDLEIAAISPPGPPFSLTSAVGDVCPQPPFTLVPDAACELELWFSPATPGIHSGIMTITSNAASSPDSVALRGAGNSAPGLGPVATAIPTLNRPGLLLLIVLIGALYAVPRFRT